MYLNYCINSVFWSCLFYISKVKGYFFYIYFFFYLGFRKLYFRVDFNIVLGMNCFVLFIIEGKC